MAAERRPITYEDREQIEAGLNRGDRLATIARSLGRTQQTVADEIRRNWTSEPKGRLVATTRNLCVHARGCDRRDVCGTGCDVPCWRCKAWRCNSACPDFEASMCPRHSKPPFCCNSCAARLGGGCGHPYRFYEAAFAQDAADSRRSEARRGIDCTPEALESAVSAIRAGLARGQSPAHVIATDPSITFSKSSFYRYVDGGTAGLMRIELPKAVRYRPRKRSVPKGRANIAAESLAGRTYADFCALPGIERACAVEMDTVVGRQGRDAQCVLTLFFRLTKLQVFMLLPDKTAASVVAALDSLEAVCGESFGALFGTVLCDRGCEFADVAGIEGSANGGGRRLRLFFCDPMQSQQKGGAEKNHVELRKCLPKGRTDFDALTQRDMAACMSHVNSYARESLSWAAPVDLAERSCPELLAGLGIERVPAAEVNLTPYLVPHAMLRA